MDYTNEILRVASDDYRADPNAVLERIAQAHVVTLVTHVNMVKKFSKGKKKEFDAKVLLVDLLDEIKKAAIDLYDRQNTQVLKPKLIITKIE
jgi:hypothetical protein